MASTSQRVPPAFSRPGTRQCVGWPKGDRLNFPTKDSPPQDAAGRSPGASTMAGAPPSAFRRRTCSFWGGPAVTGGTAAALRGHLTADPAFTRAVFRKLKCIYIWPVWLTRQCHRCLAHHTCHHKSTPPAVPSRVVCTLLFRLSRAAGGNGPGHRNPAFSRRARQVPPNQSAAAPDRRQGDDHGDI